MKYKIIDMGNDSYGVEKNGVLVIRDESMGVCDAYVFSRVHDPKTIFDVTEFNEMEG